MLNLKGQDLPDEIKLSKYIRNTYEAVRVSGLRAGQTMEIDVSLDGNYQHPNMPVKAEWHSPVTGLSGVHTALLSIADSAGFTVYCTGKAEIKNSRGRGVGFGGCSDFRVSDLWVRGARTAGIAFSDCHTFTADRLVTIGTGNYQSAKGQGKNYPGSIKLENCSDYSMLLPASLDHMGNGMTPTETKVGVWIDPFCAGVNGSQIYINASPDHTVRGGLCVGRAAAYVVNSEDNHVGVSEDIIFHDCACLDAEWGAGYWGNQGKPDQIIERAALTHSILISDGGIKIHPNANIVALNKTGTLLFTPGELAPATLANLRQLADALTTAYLKHAEQPDIDAARTALRTGFAALRKPVEPPVEPLDLVALRALVTEGEALALSSSKGVFAQAEWVKRVRTLVGE